MLDNDGEYNMLKKQYKLKNIRYICFKNFLKLQSNNSDFIHEMLSRCLLKAYENFIKIYDKELGIRNIYNMDSSVDKAYNNIINELIDY
jgi:hypothetical protein